MRSLLILLLSLSLSFAQLKVVAVYPWIGELVKEIGKDKVRLHVIAKPTEDFHFVVPRPSHIAKLRDADLLIINGASLEIGFSWLFLPKSFFVPMYRARLTTLAEEPRHAGQCPQPQDNI